MIERSAQIQRINFIEREPFVLTYRKMLLMGGTIFGCVILLSGIQTWRMASLAKKVTRLSAEVTQLEQEHERRLRESAVLSGSSTPSARSALLQIFDDSPAWSSLLREITYQAPRSLWLTSVKSVENDKNTLGTRAQMILEGRASEADAPAHFAQSLASSTLFDSAVLSSMKRNIGTTGEFYEFEVNLVISSTKKNGGKKG